MSSKKIINIAIDSTFLGITSVLLIPMLIIGIPSLLLITFFVILAMGYIYLRGKEKIELAISLILWPFVASILGLSLKSLIFISTTDVFLIWFTPFGLILFFATVIGTFLAMFAQQKIESNEESVPVQN